MVNKAHRTRDPHPQRIQLLLMRLADKRITMTKVIKSPILSGHLIEGVQKIASKGIEQVKDTLVQEHKKVKGIAESLKLQASFLQS